VPLLRVAWASFFVWRGALPEAAPTLQHIAETPGLPPDVVRGLIALARNWREQEDERGQPERRRA